MNNILKKNIIMYAAIILIAVLLSSCVKNQDSFNKNIDDNTNIPDIKLIDSHLHFVDFNQETDGFDALIEKMDKARVDRVMICGLPLKKEWNDSMPDLMSYRHNNDANYYYYSATDYKLLEEYERLSNEKKGRFYPFVCGFNPNDKYSAKFLKELFDKHKDSIYGIGEIICKHDKLTKNTYGIEPSADCETMRVIYDLADVYNVPVLIHNNITEAGDKNPKYLPEMLNALSHNKNCKIIWAHGGIANDLVVDNYIDLLDDLLSDFDNLYIDISWKLIDDYVLKNLDSWVALIEKYNDRFVIGTDQAGVFKNYEQEVKKFDLLFDKLSDETREKLKSRNFIDLINRK